jgi:hypothetical protein
VRRIYGSVEPVGRSDASGRCRRCGRPTGNTPGVIEHIDHSLGGVTWVEHAQCPPTPRKPRRDYLAPDPDDWRLC